jgi:hypothetical protein
VPSERQSDVQSMAGLRFLLVLAAGKMQAAEVVSLIALAHPAILTARGHQETHLRFASTLTHDEGVEALPLCRRLYHCSVSLNSIILPEISHKW